MPRLSANITINFLDKKYDTVNIIERTIIGKKKSIKVNIKSKPKIHATIMIPTVK